MVDDVPVSLGRVTFSLVGLPAPLGVDFAILETVGRDGDHRLSGQPFQQHNFRFVFFFVNVLEYISSMLLCPFVLIT